MAPTYEHVRCWQCGKEENLKTIYDWDAEFKGYRLDETKMKAKCRNTARKFCMTCAYSIIDELDAKKELASYLRRKKFITDAIKTMELSGIDMRKYEDTVKNYTSHLIKNEWDKLKKSSQYEVIIGILLTYNHIRFTTQQPIETKPRTEKKTKNDGRYFLDFVIPDMQIILECDGSPYHKDDSTRDTSIRKVLPDYKIIRIPAEKIQQDPESVMTYIQEAQHAGRR